jgi:hypothetical protein
VPLGRTVFRLASLGVALGLAASVANPQSLAEIAEKEKQRRKAAEAKGGKGRTLTNDDLAKTKGQLANDPGAGASPAPSPGASPAPRDAGSNVYRRATPEARSATPDRARDEGYWRGLARQRRAEVTRLTEVVEYAESLANAMAYGAPRLSDDGRTDWQAKRAQVLQDLETARQQLKQAQQALAALEDDARRAGALPAWVRE